MAGEEKKIRDKYINNKFEVYYLLSKFILEKNF